MLVKNITGVTQIDFPSNVTLPPGETVDIPYPVALRFWQRRQVQLQEGTELESSLWKDNTGMYLFWLSPFSMGDGYATAAENTMLGLLHLGMHIKAAACWFASYYGLQEETIKLLQESQLLPTRVGLCMATPGEFKKLPTPYKIGLTMYEADDPLKNMPEWKHDCAVVDMLIVPSRYCKDVFAQFVTAPIHVAPLAINPVYFQAKRKKAKDKFIFGMHGTLTGRKAPLETIEAFQKAFPLREYPNVEFQLKTRLKMLGAGQDQLPEIKDPRIKIISEDWLPNRVATWLNSTIDCYLFPSKGEGFGMTPREAMAASCPTVLSNNTGMIEVCDDRYNWPIPVRRLEDSPLGGKWRVPDWDYLIDVMRDIERNRDAAYDKAFSGAQWFAKTWSNEAVCGHMKGILEGIDPDKKKVVRLDPVESIASGDSKNHGRFLDRLESVAPNAHRVIDFGVGEGILFVELVKRGYDVVGVVQPGNRDRLFKIIRAATGKDPELIESPLVDAYKLSVRGDVLASLNVLQDYNLQELPMVLRSMETLAPMRLFSIPSVYYPERFSDTADLRRQGFWDDALANFDPIFDYYGSGKRYLMAVVRSKSDSKSGTLTRKPRKGQVVDGTWRARADDSGSRKDAE
jgi:hypothetical protein